MGKKLLASGETLSSDEQKKTKNTVVPSAKPSTASTDEIKKPTNRKNASKPVGSSTGPDTLIRAPAEEHRRWCTCVPKETILTRNYYYSALGCQPSASEEDLRLSYNAEFDRFQLIFEKQEGRLTAEQIDQFMELNFAYKILGPENRRIYDRYGLRGIERVGDTCLSNCASNYHRLFMLLSCLTCCFCCYLCGNLKSKPPKKCPVHGMFLPAEGHTATVLKKSKYANVVEKSQKRNKKADLLEQSADLHSLPKKVAKEAPKEAKKAKTAAASPKTGYEKTKEDGFGVPSAVADVTKEKDSFETVEQAEQPSPVPKEEQK
ncbi:DnaJ-like protein subfamily A member 2 [Aphelenchoides besseyi]|nr:DnaJ-like protein subfamily A member 2 [Aphelenchoides besseyi]KAI6193707.1 DnaJ-like protein subfamily A member 2 [Aphelenchoides besseyi]